MAISQYRVAEDDPEFQEDVNSAVESFQEFVSTFS